MRTPLRKIYRAFAELDRFSDAQCCLLMRRVRLDPGTSAALAVGSVSAFVVGVVVASILMARTGLVEWTERLIRDGDILVAILAFVGIPAFSGLLARDCLLHRFLIRAIQLRIDRVRCLGCKYILIGQRPIDNCVICPECARPHRLSELGITAEDLIPPESEIEPLSSERQGDEH